MNGRCSGSCSTLFAVFALSSMSWLQAQTFTGVTPGVVAADGSTQVTFQGAGFPENASATIGGKPVADLKWVDPRTLAGRAPALYPTEATGARDAAVDFGGRTGTIVLPNAVSYFSPLRLQGVLPREIPYGGGTPVEVLGTNLSAGLRVFFGSLEVAGLEVQADGTRAVGTAPALPASDPGGPRNVYAFDRSRTAVLQNGVVYVSDREGDLDGDGVEDDVDACPSTPRAARPIASGCSAMELVRAPELILQSGIDSFKRALELLDTDEDLNGFSEAFRKALAGLEGAAADLRSGQLGRALEGYHAALDGLKRALDDLDAGLDAIVDRRFGTPLEAIRNGDVDGDGAIEINDAVLLLNFLFLGGGSPAPMACASGSPRLQNGDVNGSGQIDIADGVYLLSWMFLGGPAPVNACGPERIGEFSERDRYTIHLALEYAPLLNAFQETERAVQAFEVAVRSAGAPRSARGRVAQISDAGGTLRLADGSVFAFLGDHGYPEVSEGSIVLATGPSFGDGTSLLDDLTIAEVDPQPFPSGTPMLSPCIDLRIMPVQPPPSLQWVPLYHHPDGYNHLGQGSGLWLEEGTKLAAEYLFCGLYSQDAQHYYSFSLKLELEWATQLNPASKIKTVLAEDLEDGEAVGFPAGMSTESPATLTVTRRQRLCKVSFIDFDEPSCTQWGETSKQTYTVWLKPKGFFGKIQFDRYFLDLEDSPKETRYQKVKVDYFSPYDVLTDFGTKAVFKAEAYTPIVVNGVEQSSWPFVHTIGYEDVFAAHTRDLDFYKPKDSASSFEKIFDPKSGVWQAVGLRWPHLEGQLNGRPFRYSCAVIDGLLHDRLKDCGVGLGTFHRMPFQAGSSYVMGKVNIYYGSDFELPMGTEVLATRGGVVTLVSNQSSLNCWNGGQCNCQVGAGNVLALRHEDGTYSLYAHLQKDGFLTQEGARVRRGDPLAHSGDVGCTSAPRLHLEQGNCKPFSYNCTLGQWALFEATEPPDNHVIDCYLPIEGDPLYSNNKPWWK